MAFDGSRQLFVEGGAQPDQGRQDQAHQGAPEQTAHRAPQPAEPLRRRSRRDLPSTRREPIGASTRRHERLAKGATQDSEISPPGERIATGKLRLLWCWNLSQIGNIETSFGHSSCASSSVAVRADIPRLSFAIWTAT